MIEHHVTWDNLSYIDLLDCKTAFIFLENKRNCRWLRLFDYLRIFLGNK